MSRSFGRAHWLGWSEGQASRGFYTSKEVDLYFRKVLLFGFSPMAYLALPMSGCISPTKTDPLCKFYVAVRTTKGLG